MVSGLEKAIRAIGEKGLPHSLETLPPPERYLFVLDTLAYVQSSPDGRLLIRPRRPEWRELIPPLLKEAEPYKGEITQLVREREKGACLHCSHWHPLDDSFGLCDLMPGVCGRLYGCNKFQQRRRSYAGKESI